MSSIQTGLVITGGRGPTLNRVEPWLRTTDLIAAADSGLLCANAWGVRPDLIVGDFDSLEPMSALDRYDQATIHRFPPDKDETDTEIAIRLLRDRGAQRILIAGGGGGRLDHLLGIVSLFDRTPAPDAWMTDCAVVELVVGEYHRCGVPGRTVSLFPVGTEPCRMRSNGLKWPLDGLDWKRGAIGVSNIASEGCITIVVEQGRLILIEPMEDD